MAPELIETVKCSTKVDVYSFGCVLYEVIVERQCYYDYSFKQNLEVIVEEMSYVVLLKSGCRSEANSLTWNAARYEWRMFFMIEPCALMKRCWLKDKERPTMKEVVRIIENWNPSRWDMDVMTTADIWSCLLQTTHNYTSKDSELKEWPSSFSAPSVK